MALEMSKDTRSEILRRLGRITVMAYYDHQQVRIQSMNRIRDIIWRKDKGVPFDVKIDKTKYKSYGKYKDEEIPPTLDRLLNEGKITQEERDYIARIYDLAKAQKIVETSFKPEMIKYIKDEKAYVQFLIYIRGIGPVLGSNLMRYIGYCERFDTVSKLWAYCGLPVKDGHAIKLEKGQTIHFNPQLRVLCWKIGTSFVKKRTPFFRQEYDRYKAKELARTDENKPKRPLHAELRARRYIAKKFLQLYWECGRELVGLPTRRSYVEEKLGHTGIIHWEDLVRFMKEAKEKI